MVPNPPPRTITTRGHRVAIPESIQRHSREELREKREQKEAEKKAEQEKKRAGKQAKQQQQADAGKRIAALEDRQTTRNTAGIPQEAPSTTVSDTEPAPNGNTSGIGPGHGATRSRGRGRGRGRGHGHGNVGHRHVDASDGRGTGRGRGRGRGDTGHGRGRGNAGCGRGRGSGHVRDLASGGSSDGMVELTYGESKPSSIDNGEESSDVEIPPATVMDTESEGAVDIEHADSIDDSIKDVDGEAAERAQGIKNMQGPIIIDSDGDDSDDDYQEEDEINSR